MFKSTDTSKMISVTVIVLEAVSAEIATEIITGWLMRFKGKAEKIVIERQDVEFDEGKLKHVIQDRLSLERNV